MRRLLLVALLAASLGLSTVPAAQAVTARVITLRTFAVYPQAGAEMTVFGTVSATPAGSAVTIQELESDAWTDIGTATVGPDGSYSHSFTLASEGTKSYRSLAAGTSELAAATSPILKRWIRPPPATPFDTAPSPVLVGKQVVGSRLTVDFGSWSPQPSRFYVQWVRNGKLIAAYGPAYRLTAQDLGKQMTVTVAAERSESRTVRESRPGPVVGKGTFVARAPTISGQLSVGQTVTAVVSWTPQPATRQYQWLRDAAPIEGATSEQYTLTPDDSGTDLSVEVRGESPGYEPATATSNPVPVAGSPPVSDVTFGDVMEPRSGDVVAASSATYTSQPSPPSWDSNRLTRWDQQGAFTHALDPSPMGDLYSDYYGYDIRKPANGAEYVSSNSIFKSADIEFTFTGRRFAVEYKAHADSDAMIWIDNRPISGSPIVGRDKSTDQTGTEYWITVDLAQRRTVTVRFAGPLFFTGVHTPAAENALITATEPRFTLGVLGDSYFDTCSGARCLSRGPGPALGTATGFRVWNMAEGGTGYLNDGSGINGAQTGEGRGVPGHTSSPFGSARHLAAIQDAPLDALLVNGSANDRVNWTAAQHRTALETLLDDLERTRPGLPVVVVGIEPLAFTRNSYWSPYFGQLTSNFTGVVGRHPNLVGFIDPYTDPWLTGTGSSTNPKGDGNQDLYIGQDGLHLNAQGQVYYQGRIANALKDLPLPTGSN